MNTPFAQDTETTWSVLLSQFLNRFNQFSDSFRAIFNQLSSHLDTFSGVFGDFYWLHQLYSSGWSPFPGDQLQLGEETSFMLTCQQQFYFCCLVWVQLYPQCCQVKNIFTKIVE